MFRGLKSKPMNKRPARSRPSGTNNLAGAKFVPSDDPPVLIGQPWSNIVIDTGITFGTGTWSYYTGQELYKALLNQAGFNGSDKVSFEVRLLSISLWASEIQETASAMSYARICVMPMDVIHSGNIELTRLESNAMRNKFAKVGYHYPLSVSSVPILIASNSAQYILSHQSSTKAHGILHLKILWRGSNAGFKVDMFVSRYVGFRPPNPSVTDDDDPVVEDNSSDVLDLDTLVIN